MSGQPVGFGDGVIVDVRDDRALCNPGARVPRTAQTDAALDDITGSCLRRHRSTSGSPRVVDHNDLVAPMLEPRERREAACEQRRTGACKRRRSTTAFHADDSHRPR